MAVTTATTYGSTIRTEHLMKLVETAKGFLVASKFASSKDIEKGAGDTIRVNKILRPALTTSSRTQGTLVTPGDAKALYSNFQEYSLENWGDSFGFNEDVDITSWISNKDNQETIARQMAMSLDKEVMKKISLGAMRFRTDTEAATYQQGAAAIDTTNQSTTAFYSTTGSFGEADDFWNGGFFTITNASGANYDITRAITDYTSVAMIVTTDAFPQAHLGTVQQSKGWAVVGTNLTASDTATPISFLKTTGMHEKVQTEKFDGGIYRCFLPSEVHVDLQQDTTWINSVVYDESFHLGTFRLGRIFDIEFLTTSQPYREDADGTANDAGAVYVVPVFGKDSYSVYNFANKGGTDMFSVAMYVVDQPDSQNLRNSARWLSWKGQWAGGVNRATSMIGLMTGATNMEVLI